MIAASSGVSGVRPILAEPHNAGVGRTSRWLPPACVVILIALFYWPLLSGIYSIFDVGPDITVMSVPDLELRAKALRSGIIPIWDPYQMGGQSPLGEVTPAVLDPFSYPLLLMPLRKGHIPLGHIQIYYVLLHCLAGLAAYFLVKDCGVKSSIAAVGAGVYYAVAGVTGNAIWFQVVTEAIYAPLILLFLFRSLRGIRPLANSAIAGLLLGLSWFSGTHHVPLIMSFSCGALLLAFALIGNFWRGLKRLAVFGTVMVLVSAPQVVPALQWSKMSMRWVLLDQPVPGSAKVPYLAHLLEYVHPSSILNLIIPANHTNWGNFVFAGVVAMVFAAIGLSKLNTSRLVKVLLAFAVAGVLMAISDFNTWYGVSYVIVPMFDKLRESAFWMFLVHLAVACLVALGIDEWLRREFALEPRFIKLLALGSVLLLAVAYRIGLLTPSGFQKSGDEIAVSGLVALLLATILYMDQKRSLSSGLAAAMVIGLLMLEHGNVAGKLHFPRGHGWVSRYELPLRETEPIAQFLRSREDLERIEINKEDVPFNFGDLHLIEETGSHGGSMLTSVFRIRFWTPEARRLYGVNYYVARKPAQPNQVEVFTAPSGVKVFRNPEARPRVWTVHNVVSVADYDEATRLLSSPSFDMAASSFLQGEVPTVQSCTSPDQVQLVRRTWFHVVIRVTMACRGMVVLNDNWYPGWRASIDGTGVPIYSAYMTMRGVVVESGTHQIEMLYRPRSLYLGLVLFVLGLGTTILLVRRTEAAETDLLGY